MKCKICGGTGTSNTCVNGTFKPCTFCDGTGEYEPFDADVELDKLYPVEQTNEEWFDSLPTEEKAMAIVLCCPYEIDWFGENFEKRMEQRMKNLSQSAQGYGLGIQKIKVWLKQPHTKGDSE